MEQTQKQLTVWEQSSVRRSALTDSGVTGREMTAEAAHWMDSEFISLDKN